MIKIIDNIIELKEEQLSEDSIKKLVKQAKEDDQAAIQVIIDKYYYLILSKCKTLFLKGGDKDDLIQEGLYGLYKAIRDYDIDKNTCFTTFAKLCIERQLITAVKRHDRQKHTILNDSISYDAPIYSNSNMEESNRSLIEALPGVNSHDTPEKIVISNHIFELLQDKIINTLSNFELDVLQEYLQGKSYEDMAKILNRSTKSIDNALQRVKIKTGDIFKEISFSVS
ncbi:MAG: sigma-70 family RNA polymerase sigma factor [bacterium]